MADEVDEAMEQANPHGKSSHRKDCRCGYEDATCLEIAMGVLAAEVTRLRAEVERKDEALDLAAGKLRAAATIIAYEAVKIETGDAPGLRAAARDLRDTARALTPSPDG